MKEWRSFKISRFHRTDAEDGCEVLEALVKTGVTGPCRQTGLSQRHDLSRTQRRPIMCHALLLLLN